MSAEPPRSSQPLSHVVQRLHETLRSRGPAARAVNAIYEFELLAAARDADPVDADPVDANPVDANPVDADQVDTVRVDTVRVDTVRVDTVRVDTVRVDTVRVDLREGHLAVQQGEAAPTRPADCRLILTCDDFVDLVEGRVSGQALFGAGKLRIDGDLGLAMKLQQLTELLR